MHQLWPRKTAEGEEGKEINTTHFVLHCVRFSYSLPQRHPSRPRFSDLSTPGLRVFEQTLAPSPTEQHTGSRTPNSLQPCLASSLTLDHGRVTTASICQDLSGHSIDPDILLQARPACPIGEEQESVVCHRTQTISSPPSPPITGRQCYSCDPD